MGITATTSALSTPLDLPPEIYRNIAVFLGYPLNGYISPSEHFESDEHLQQRQAQEYQDCWDADYRVFSLLKTCRSARDGVYSVLVGSHTDVVVRDWRVLRDWTQSCRALVGTLTVAVPCTCSWLHQETWETFALFPNLQRLCILPHKDSTIPDYICRQPSTLTPYTPTLDHLKALRISLSDELLADRLLLPSVRKVDVLVGSDGAGGFLRFAVGTFPGVCVLKASVEWGMDKSMSEFLGDFDKILLSELRTIHLDLKLSVVHQDPRLRNSSGCIRKAFETFETFFKAILAVGACPKLSNLRLSFNRGEPGAFPVNQSCQELPTARLYGFVQRRKVVRLEDGTTTDMFEVIPPRILWYENHFVPDDITTREMEIYDLDDGGELADDASYCSDGFISD